MTMGKKKYCKILDRDTALAICLLGFNFIEERIGEGMTAYCFENTEEFNQAFESIRVVTGFADVPYTEEDTITL